MHPTDTPPTTFPTHGPPTPFPTASKNSSSSPSNPSLQPSSKPSLQPSSKLSLQPSSKPLLQPSSKPSLLLPSSQHFHSFQALPLFVCSALCDAVDHMCDSNPDSCEEINGSCVPNA